MKSAFYSGASGLMAYQQALDNIGHNLANVNTTGYKAQKVGFESLMHRYMYVNSPEKPLTGSGVKQIDLGLNTNAGSLNLTGYVLDFAIQGNGWFAVEKNGQREYTRNGMFDIGLVNGVPYLTDTQGAFVLDQQGNKIQFPVDKNGTPILDGVQQRVGVFQIQRAGMMTPVAENRYRANEYTGQVKPAVYGTDYTLKQGSIEQSNVQMDDEMTRMIMTQRAFQMSARVIQVSDELEQNVNGLRR